MSGVEVAGLVLGCLPLIIQGACICVFSTEAETNGPDKNLGIETYNEGLDPIKSFMRWERELPQFIRKLRNQHVHYAQSIRILLEPITTEVELSEMFADPGASQQLWKSKDMANKLQERLQESYEAYQSTIADIERITKLIAGKLDLDRAKEVGAFLPILPSHSAYIPSSPAMISKHWSPRIQRNPMTNSSSRSVYALA